VTRLSIILFVSLLLQLAACATAPLPTVSNKAPEPVVETVAEPEPVVTPKAQPPEPDKSHIRLSIAAVGDMMLGTDYPENHLPDDDGVSFLADVSASISDADIGFGNLEGVLVDGGQPGKKCSNPAACYLFRSPTRYADHYKVAGFDVLSLANNHARDFAEDGRTSSMHAIAARGMHHSGREGDFASFEVNGLKVAFLAYAVTQGSNLLHDYELAFETVADSARDHDIVVVSFHGGAEGVDVTHIPFAEEEYYGEPRGDVVWFARGVVDAGADLVIGHGPHVVRGMERYKNRLIAYSLGNFATYYGISVAGVKGVAPILTTTMDGNGNFLSGDIVSTVQLRPAGPSIDQEQRALNLIRSLSIKDFGTPGLRFHGDGQLLPAERDNVQQHVLVIRPD
jgi:hypothetical protein